MRPTRHPARPRPRPKPRSRPPRTARARPRWRLFSTRQSARGELTLRGDLDMDDVSLYAVVARVEREAKVTLNDAVVEQWVTLADLLDAVSDAVSNR